MALVTVVGTTGTTAYAQFVPNMALDISCNEAASVRSAGAVLVAGFDPAVSAI